MNYDTKLKELNDLYIEYNDTTSFGDYTITVEQDQDPMNPRTECDNLGTMICFHNRYNLGDEHNYSCPNQFFHVESGLYPDETYEYLEDEQLDRCRDVFYKNNVVLPLYLYDHSGITMNTTGFHCPWDSGQVGFIYVSRKKIREEYSISRVTKKMHKLVEGYLKGEVETYDHFLTGSVYGYSIEKDGEDLESCWGFFGYYTDDDNYMVNEIKSHIKYDSEHTPQQMDLEV